MKRILFFVSLCCFLIIVKAQAAEKYPNTILWKISGNGLTKSSYLYGTIHLRNPKVFDFSDSVVFALDNSDAIIIESDPYKIVNDLLNTDDENIDDNQTDYSSTADKIRKYYTKDEYLKIDKFFIDNYKIKIKDINDPSPRNLITIMQYKEGAEVWLDSTEGAANTILDYYIYNFGNIYGKKLLSLETMQQIDSMAKLVPDKNFKELLLKITIIDNFNDYKNSISQSIDSLTKIYLDNNLQAINDWYIDGNNAGYDKNLLKMRNTNMANNIVRYLPENKCFIAVGVAHLPGDSGLINMLRVRGYSVEPVFSPKNGLYANFKYKEKRLNWKNYDDPNYGFTCKLPGQPVEKSTSQIPNCKMFMDMTSNSIFMTGTISIPSAEKGAKDSLLSKVRSSLNSDTSAIVKMKDTIVNGYNAIDLSLNLHEKLSMLFRLFILDKKVHMLVYMKMFPNDLSTYERDYFFNSFDTLAIETLKWQEYAYPEYGFRIKMPNNAKFNQYFNQEKDSYYEHRLISVDYQNQITYSLYCIESINGFQIQKKDKDTYYKNYYVNRIGQDNIDSIFSKYDTLSDCHHLTIIDKSGLYYDLRIYSKGNRMYYSGVDTKKDNIDLINKEFINSFELLQTIRKPLKLYSFDDMQVLLPSESINKSEVNHYGKYFFDAYKEQNRISIDENNFFAYKVNVMNFDDYYQITDNDCHKFFKKIFDLNDGYLSEEYRDSVITDKYFQTNGMHYFTFKSCSKQTDYCKQIKAVLKGNKVYSIRLTYKLKEQNDSIMAKIFDSFKVFEGNIQGDLLSDKFNTILKDINSKDTIVAKCVRNSLRKYKVQDSQKEILKKLSLSEQPSIDTVSFNSFKDIIINKLVELNDSSISDFFIENYDKVSVGTTNKTNLLAAITESGSEKSFQFVIDKLIELSLDESEDFYPYEITNNFTKHLDKLAIYKDKLAELFNNENLRTISAELFIEMLDSNKLNSKDIQKYEEKVYDICLQIKSSIDNPEENEDEYFVEDEEIEDAASAYIYDYNTFINLLGYIGNSAKSKEFLKSRIHDDDVWSQFYSITGLIRLGEIVDKICIDSLSDNLNTRATFYQSLERMNKLTLFKDEYKNQIEISKSELYTIINEEETGIPDSTKYIKQIVNNENGQDSVYYLYSFMTIEDSTKYLGFAGPYPLNSNKIILNANAIGSNYDIISPETDLNGLLKKYIDDLKNIEVPEIEE